MHQKHDLNQVYELLNSKSQAKVLKEGGGAFQLRSLENKKLVFIANQSKTILLTHRFESA